MFCSSPLRQGPTYAREFERCCLRSVAVGSGLRSCPDRHRRVRRAACDLAADRTALGLCGLRSRFTRYAADNRPVILSIGHHQRGGGRRHGSHPRPFLFHQVSALLQHAQAGRSFAGRVSCSPSSFVVEREADVPATTLDAVLDRLGLPGIDWLKTDSQGIDLRLSKA